MKTIMVVGASGVLGNLICEELLRIYENQIKLIVTDYKPERGKKLAASFATETTFVQLDIKDETNINQVIKNVDLVIVVLKQQKPHIQRVCIENNIMCIDVTPFRDFVDKVMELNDMANENNVGSIVMSGFFPGLSGLVVKEAISPFLEVTEIDIALLQNTNAKTGLAGILDMLKIIAEPVMYQKKLLPGFTKKRTMYFIKHTKDRKVRLIDHSEKAFIKQRLTTAPLHYWTAWNVSIFNKMVSLLKKAGFITFIHKVKPNNLSRLVRHNPTKDENAFITVEVKGVLDNKKLTRRISISAFSDYHVTAMVTAALAKIALQKEFSGVVFPFKITNFDEVLSVINCPNAILTEYT
ncbi:SDR family NAD(P)-dependent oxidoreductase [Oceanobacillus kapialis]|uniref:SDR family NAD(P)-dependent oxidoreductase n=1 Tax=Oceanobacillus kapialis TaxID=481353 RepID=UPI00385041BA